jgi:putative hydrolase of the HAD superfamily
MLNPSKKYKHLFIDLDKTLWDFEANSRETFQELYLKYELRQRGIADLEEFHSVYHKHNMMLWDLYRKNQILKELLNVKRFELTFNDYGIYDLLMIAQFAEEYITTIPKKKHLYPGVEEALEELYRRYSLHIITNGFEEVQFEKIDNCGFRPLFKTITTSEEAGVKKPESDIFHYALRKAHAHASESLMIGDDLGVDIEGAKSVNMDQLLFNPDAHPHDYEVTYEVRTWKEITELLLATTTR